MSQELSPEERLRILRLADHERRWYTVDDQRLCLICERIISGRQIRIGGGAAKYLLGCPTLDCPGNPSHWFLYRPGSGQPATPLQDGAGEVDFLSAFEQPGLPGQSPSADAPGVTRA